MPDKSNYPQWFKYSQKPKKPAKPQEYYYQNNKLHEQPSLCFDNYSIEFTLEVPLPQNVTKIIITNDYDIDYTGTFVLENSSIAFFDTRKVKNPNYEQELDEYEKKWKSLRNNFRNGLC